MYETYQGNVSTMVQVLTVSKKQKIKVEINSKWSNINIISNDMLNAYQRKTNTFSFKKKLEDRDQRFLGGYLTHVDREATAVDKTTRHAQLNHAILKTERNKISERNK